MLILVRSFSYRHFSCWISEKFLFLSYSVLAGFRQDMFFLYYICNDDTDTIPDVMLRPNKDARASHRLGKCRLSWVGLGLGLLSALSVCSACLGSGSHRHASSGFVSVQTDSAAQSWHDLVRTSVFLFTLIVLFSEELLLHSSSWF